MKFPWKNRYVQCGITLFLVIAASMLLYYTIFHMGTLVSGVKTITNIMMPIIYGIVIAFLLSPILNFLEKKLIYPLLGKKNITLEKRGRKAVRWICVILCLCLFLAILYALLAMMLPELIRSIMNLIYSFPGYVKVVQDWLQSITEKGWDLDSHTIDLLEEYAGKAQDYLTKNILPQMQLMLKNITSGVFDIITFLKNFIIGAIVSLYLMADKEGFVAKGKMIAYALFNTKHANFIIHAMRFTYKTFIGFFTGKLLDSAIIGVLCYIGMNLMDMPYVLLVSVIVGVTNIIPFFGPYLGAIPSIILILLVDPKKALYFTIFIIVLQQFDGNILGPKILGDSTGLSSFLVIVAILIGGGLFGIPGMVIGVPVFAVLYAAVRKLVHMVLAYKKVPDKEEDYLDIDCLDPETNERIPYPETPPKKRERPRRTVLLEFILTVLKTLQMIFFTVWEYVKRFGKAFYRKVRQLLEEYQQKRKDKDSGKK